MKRQRKWLATSLIAATASMGLFAGCDGALLGSPSASSSSSNEVSTNAWADNLTPQEIMTVNLVYAQAQELGFEGPLEEFLALCKGKDGEDGVGIADVYVIDGDMYVMLTDATIINIGKVKGEKGDQGDQGETGKSAYEIWLENGNVGSETDFLDWLKGEKGDQGDQGIQGETGKSAYDIWLENGNVGTEADFLDWLKGEKGDQGDQGIQGEQGVGILKAEIDADGNLVLYYTDNPTVGVVIGKVVGEDGEDGEDAVGGISIMSIEINNENRIVIMLSNGLKLVCGALSDTAIGNMYTNIYMGVDKVIKVTLSSGYQMNLGTLSEATFNEAGELIILLTNGQSLTLGKIAMAQGSACNHVYSEWVVGEAATCDSMGYNVRVCGNCSALEYDFIPAVGHTWGKAYMMQAPTATEDGALLYACSVCKVAKIEVMLADGDEDSDGLTNYEELYTYSTNPLADDTDGDGLTDYEEVMTYSTDPVESDTDGDGCGDGKEVQLGFDPLVAQSSFQVTYQPVVAPEVTVKPTVEVELEGEQVETLKVEESNFFTEETQGYLGQAYKYEVEGAIENATVGFTYDETEVAADAEITIYEFDEEAKEMRPLPTTVSNGVATTEVNSFATYMLLDRKVFEASRQWVDVWGTGTTYSALEVIFVIDDSGSLGGDYGYNSSTGSFTGGNDPQHQRLNVAKTFIDGLGATAKVGIIKFDSSTYNFTPNLVTCDEAGKTSLKDILKISPNSNSNYLFDSRGGTYMYAGINLALGEYESTSKETLKVMIVLSDGQAHDTSRHSSTITAAKNAGVLVYTVGLGTSSSTYFDNYMKPLASGTAAKYYHASAAGGLSEIYDDIQVKVDLETDLDNDGLCDYYEDNMVAFGGESYELDKNNPDTDGDGLLDGEEVVTVKVYSEDGTKMTILGKVYSDPTNADSDGDGIPDKYDPTPWVQGYL